MIAMQQASFFRCMANVRTDLDVIHSSQFFFQHETAYDELTKSEFRCACEEGALACVRGAFKTYPAGSTVNAGLSEDLSG